MALEETSRVTGATCRQVQDHETLADCIYIVHYHFV